MKWIVLIFGLFMLVFIVIGLVGILYYILKSKKRKWWKLKTLEIMKDFLYRLKRFMHGFITISMKPKCKYWPICGAIIRDYHAKQVFPYGNPKRDYIGTICNDEIRHLECEHFKIKKNLAKNNLKKGFIETSAKGGQIQMLCPISTVFLGWGLFFFLSILSTYRDTY